MTIYMLQEIGISLGIFLVYLLFRKTIMKIVFKILAGITTRTKMKADDQLVEAFAGPIKMLITFSILYFSIKLIDTTVFEVNPVHFKNLAAFNVLLFKIYRSVILYFFFWGFFNACDSSAALFKELEDILDLKVDKLLLPFVSKILRLVLVLIGLAAIANEWGFDVNGFVAGLGIGGLAFALAAKDTLANAFGGAVLITEKPFTIGDWIVVAGEEGVVEDLNFRSTKLRKFDKSVVTVPNSVITTTNIVNFSKRDIRRITYKLGIKYSTPIETIRLVIKEIEDMLIKHSDINNETIFVKFDEFADSSLNIFMYYFTNTSVWGEYLSIKQDTNLKIMEILQNHGVEIAFPSQSVYFEGEANTIKVDKSDTIKLDKTN